MEEVFEVTLKEDLFLSELEEYSNSTTDEIYTLTIPNSEGTFSFIFNIQVPLTSKISAIRGNETYYFTLNVTCPSNVADTNQINLTANELSPSSDFRVTSAEVQVKTLPYPLTEGLIVTPTEGVYSQTRFTYSVQVDQKAKVLSLFKFGYVADNVSAIFRVVSGVSEGFHVFQEGLLVKFFFWEGFCIFGFSWIL